MQISVIVPVANLLIYKPFTYGGLQFLPASDFTDSETSDTSIGPSENNIWDELESGNLSKAISAITGVSKKDFQKFSNVVFDLNIPDFDLNNPKRNDDEYILAQALIRTERTLDLLKFDYARLDITQYTPMAAGFLPSLNYLAIYLYDRSQFIQRIIAREPENSLSIPGLGLELENTPEECQVAPLVLESFSEDTLGRRLQRLLRIFGQTFTATSDDQKILNLIFALDGLLTLEDSKSQQFKEAVEFWLRDISMEKFSNFYRDVRNPLVHRGFSYEELGRNRQKDLLYIQRIVALLLTNLMPYRNMNFNEFWKKHSKAAG